MKNKNLFILGLIILANTSYSDEKQVEVITSNIELQKIFMQTTLDEVERGLPKKYVNAVKEIPVTEKDEIEVIPVITLDLDKNDNVVVKNIETADISIHNDKKEYDIPHFVQTQRTVKKWTENDIEDYYKQKRHTNTSVTPNYKGTVIKSDKKVSEHKTSQGALTIHFSNGTNFANTQELVDLHNYINTNNIKSIKLVGHADKTGTVEQNAEISVYRADKVRQELMKYGVKKDIITITGRGHLEPVDTVNIKRNRRVEVYFTK